MDKSKNSRHERNASRHLELTVAATSSCPLNDDDLAAKMKSIGLELGRRGNQASTWHTLSFNDSGESFKS